MFRLAVAATEGCDDTAILSNLGFSDLLREERELRHRLSWYKGAIGILGGVGQKVRHDLLQPGGVGEEPNRGWRQRHREFMSALVDQRLNIGESTPAVVPIHPERAVPLHRLGEARRQENLSHRTVARHLGITVEEVKRQECETTDLPLSVLYEWAKVLDQPVAELVQDTGYSLSMPLFNRAHMALVMKTAMTILERAGDPRMKRLAQTMVDQLIEIMPELRGVPAWPVVGKPNRTLNDLGVAAKRSFSDEVFRDAAD